MKYDNFVSGLLTFIVPKRCEQHSFVAHTFRQVCALDRCEDSVRAHKARRAENFSSRCCIKTNKR